MAPLRVIAFYQARTVVWAALWILLEIGVLIAFVLLGVARFKVRLNSCLPSNYSLTPVFRSQRTSDQMYYEAGTIFVYIFLFTNLISRI